MTVGGCRGAVAAYCLLLALAGFASILVVIEPADPAMLAALLVAAAVPIALGAPWAALVVGGVGAFAAAASLHGVLSPWEASVLAAAAPGVAAIASRRAGVALAAASALAVPDSGLVGIAAASAVVAVAAAAETSRLHAILAGLVLSLTILAPEWARPMAAASLLAWLLAAAGGPRGLRSCPFRADNTLAVAGMVVSALAVASSMLESAAWTASLLWPVGFVAQLSGLLVPAPPWASGGGARPYEGGRGDQNLFST